MHNTDQPAPTDAETVVRQYCNAWMAGDTTGLLELYHPDLTLKWPGGHRLAGTYSGLDACATALLTFQQLTNRRPIKVLDILATDRTAVVVVSERWQRNSFEPLAVELTRALHYTVESGKIRACQVFEADQHTVDRWLRT